MILDAHTHTQTAPPASPGPLHTQRETQKTNQHEASLFRRTPLHSSESAYTETKPGTELVSKAATHTTDSGTNDVPHLDSSNTKISSYHLLQIDPTSVNSKLPGALIDSNRSSFSQEYTYNNPPRANSLNQDSYTDFSINSTGSDSSILLPHLLIKEMDNDSVVKSAADGLSNSSLSSPTLNSSSISPNQISPSLVASVNNKTFTNEPNGGGNKDNNNTNTASINSINGHINNDGSNGQFQINSNIWSNASNSESPSSLRPKSHSIDLNSISSNPLLLSPTIPNPNRLSISSINSNGSNSLLPPSAGQSIWNPTQPQSQQSKASNDRSSFSSAGSPVIGFSGLNISSTVGQPSSYNPNISSQQVWNNSYLNNSNPADQFGNSNNGNKNNGATFKHEKPYQWNSPPLMPTNGPSLNDFSNQFRRHSYAASPIDLPNIATETSFRNNSIGEVMNLSPNLGNPLPPGAPNLDYSKTFEIESPLNANPSQFVNQFNNLSLQGNSQQQQSQQYQQQQQFQQQPQKLQYYPQQNQLQNILQHQQQRQSINQKQLFQEVELYFGVPSPESLNLSKDLQELRNQGVHLPNFPLQTNVSDTRLIFVCFKNTRCDVFFLKRTDIPDISVGKLVFVEADRGHDLGKVVRLDVSLDEARLLKFRQFQDQQAVLGNESGNNQNHNLGGPALHYPKRILAIAEPKEMTRLLSKRDEEEEAKADCQMRIRLHNLNMTIFDAEYQFDSKKLTFYYISNLRIDFRDLIRELFRKHKTRIWMCAISSYQKQLQLQLQQQHQQNASLGLQERLSNPSSAAVTAQQILTNNSNFTQQNYQPVSQFQLQSQQAQQPRRSSLLNTHSRQSSINGSSNEATTGLVGLSNSIGSNTHRRNSSLGNSNIKSNLNTNGF